MKSLKPEAPCSIDAEAIRSFADVTGDHNPLHVDPAIAAQHGLSACIVPGAMLTIHMEKYVRSLFPSTVVRQVRTRFVSALAVDQAFQCSGRVVRSEDKQGGSSHLLRILCKTSDQVPVCMGDVLIEVSDPKEGGT